MVEKTNNRAKFKIVKESVTFWKKGRDRENERERGESYPNATGGYIKKGDCFCCQYWKHEKCISIKGILSCSSTC